MVRGVGFEPTNSERADLQSAVFDRFTNPAYFNVSLARMSVYCLGAACRIRTDDPQFTKLML